MMKEMSTRLAALRTGKIDMLSNTGDGRCDRYHGWLDVHGEGQTALIGKLLRSCSAWTGRFTCSMDAG